MSEVNGATEPTAGSDSLTDYLFNPTAGEPTVGRVKRHASSPSESHAENARRILGKLAAGNGGDVVADT